MWVFLGLISMTFLGFYDVAKKSSLKGNPVIPVLTISTAVSLLFFLPFIINCLGGFGWFEGTMFEISRGTPREQILLLLKAMLVLSSWTLGYYGLRSVPLSIYGPINATRPVFVLLGAILIFGERLNLLQWTGVLLSLGSLYMLSLTSRRNEGIDFKHNRGICCCAAATLLGAASALYDKYLLREMDSVFVQSWFNFYNAILMAAVMLLVWLPQHRREVKAGKGSAVQPAGAKADDSAMPLKWKWSIPLISVCVSIADFAYMYALTFDGSMISVLSTIRRGSVIISFLCAAIIFKEKNLTAKAVDLAVVLLGMVFLLLGSL